MHAADDVWTDLAPVSVQYRALILKEKTFLQSAGREDGNSQSRTASLVRPKSTQSGGSHQDSAVFQKVPSYADAIVNYLDPDDPPPKFPVFVIVPDDQTLDKMISAGHERAMEVFRMTGDSGTGSPTDCMSPLSPSTHAHVSQVFPAMVGNVTTHSVVAIKGDKAHKDVSAAWGAGMPHHPPQ